MSDKTTSDDEKQAHGPSLKKTMSNIIEEALESVEALKVSGENVRDVLREELKKARAEIRESLDKSLEEIRHIDFMNLKGELKGRANVVMTRVKDIDIEAMDTLVEAGLFDSRSECAAFLMHAGIEARRNLIEKVKETAKKIAELKESLRRELA